MDDLTFSIRTSLAASTVTPGSTGPEASLTTPLMALCASASPADSTQHTPTSSTDLDRPPRFPDDIAPPPENSISRAMKATTLFGSGGRGCGQQRQLRKPLPRQINGRKIARRPGRVNLFGSRTGAGYK